MLNKKGFTLIELLAVIIILAVLLLIAIPAVSNYINDSRKEAYVKTAKQVISGARNLVNSGKLDMYDTDTTYYIPSSCIKVENGETAKSPYGEFVKAYVAVTYSGHDYDYYWTSVDESNVGIELISYDDLSTEAVKTNINKDDIQNTNTILGTSKYRIYEEDNCMNYLEKKIKYLYDILKEAAEKDNLVKEYTGNHQDSPSGNGKQRIYYFYANNAADGNSIKEKNNVIFANYCWQILRTTDTGGVKLIYNGVAEDGKCNNSGYNATIGNSKFVETSNPNSIAFVGYMNSDKYPTNLVVANSIVDSNYIFGKDYTYSDGKYKLKETVSSNYFSTNARYTCFSTSDECETLSYIFYLNYWYYYINLTNGENELDALKVMLSNEKNNSIKNKVDNWYKNNMLNYTKYLEDVVYCNDRSISSYGQFNKQYSYGTYASVMFHEYNKSTDLSCINETDRFSLSNPKAKLIYPVGLASSPEINIINDDNARNIGKEYWLSSASMFSSSSYNVYVNSNGRIANGISHSSMGVRPVVSLAPGTEYSDGDGSRNNPYIIIEK